MQKRNRLFAVILAVFVMAIVAPMAFAADEVVTIDLANGNVIINETGYLINGGAETAFTGDYIFTGKNDETQPGTTIHINSLAEGTDITLKDVEIAQKGPQCIVSLVDLTLEATGSVKMSNSSPVIVSGAQKIEIKGDADISVTSGAHLADVPNGTINIACKNLELTSTGIAPIVYRCADFKVNAQEDVVIDGWTSAVINTDIIAGGDIFAGNEKTTAAVFTETASLKSINGDITIDHKGIICSGNDFVLEAAGDVTVNADTSNPAFSAGSLTISGDNVTLTNASGMLTSVSTTDIDAKGDITIEGNTGSPVVTGGVAYFNADGNITLTNNASVGMLSTVATMDIAAKGDITLTAECSSPMMYTNITATSENGTVAMTNKGSFFITSGNLVVDAKDIVLTVVGAGPITQYSYDLTAENDITISTGYSATAYSPVEPTAYDFGNKLTVTTSAGTTEHTHEYADVAYNNDATCEADGTKLDHVDADGDYKCDNGCGYEFEKPAEPEADCACGKEHNNFFDIIICFVKGVIDIISEMLLGE